MTPDAFRKLLYEIAADTHPDSPEPEPVPWLQAWADVNFPASADLKTQIVALLAEYPPIGFEGFPYHFLGGSPNDYAEIQFWEMKLPEDLTVNWTDESFAYHPAIEAHGYAGRDTPDAVEFPIIYATKQSKASGLPMEWWPPITGRDSEDDSPSYLLRIDYDDDEDEGDEPIEEAYPSPLQGSPYFVMKDYGAFDYVPPDDVTFGLASADDIPADWSNHYLPPEASDEVKKKIKELWDKLDKQPPLPPPADDTTSDE